MTETVEKKEVEDAKPDENTLTDEVVTKYQTAADISNKALSAVVAASVEGTSILELCKLGDSSITDGAKSVYAKKKDMMKGIAYPTCVSVGNVTSKSKLYSLF